jgi:hypothetical protein
MNTPAPSTPKLSSRIVLVGLTDPDAALITECFKQFKISTRRVDEDAVTVLQREKYEGAVIRLSDPQAEAVLKAARESRSNRGMVIYGIAPGFRPALGFSKYGINAVLTDPLERNNVLKAVRSTYLLALHEFRRYVRIPIAISVQLRVNGRTISTMSHEVSSGGMSLESADLLPGKVNVDVTFQLPGEDQVTMPAEICWRREPSSTLGVRFDAQDVRRQVVRNWIEAYMDD